MKHLILGSGPAGVIAAETLRKADPSAEIVLAGAETGAPYSRMAIPYLLEEKINEAGTRLRPDDDHYQSLSITRKDGQATAVDPGAKTVRFADGSSESYDRLLIATGSHPIRPPIPGIDLDEVQTCWTLEDARAIAARAAPGSRVVQVGAGFIGSIIMESLKKRGVDLTVVELGDRMVPRMMTATAGAMIKDWVEGKGIRVVTGAKVEKIEKQGALSVTLSTGEVIGCDLVIMSAGVRPNVGFLDGSGVETGTGVLVNSRMESSVAGIYAAGDVAEAPDMLTGEPTVNAIQPNAADQARIAACNMAGGAATQEGTLAINVLDTLGLVSSSFGQWQGVEGGDGVELSQPERHRYISLQFEGERLVGATAVGLTDHVGVLRGLIQGKLPLGAWKDVLLKDPLRVTDAYIAMGHKPLSLAR